MKNQVEYLYETDEDPAQKDNLAEANEAKRTEMAGRLDSYLAEQG